MARHSETTLAAIKQNVDIVALAGDYGLALHRAGAIFKALCPFHDDHNPSLELNPVRQSYKCWSCGAGGDVFDFVVAFDRVEFPEALRMLAERAGIALETAADRADSPATGPSKSELLGAMAWAEAEFAASLRDSADARAYADSRGISADSIERFRLGFAPDSRDWLGLRARKPGFSTATLEAAGLIARDRDSNLTRDRFRGRLIFPIRDARGRAIAFGGRILPAAEKRMADSGLGVAKYLNSPETALFQKRRNLYGADLARDPARKAGWVAVVEGYTDVIAAHQAGLTNVVGTLGTAFGDDHVTSLKRLADRAILVLDGDDAGRNASDKALPVFLGHDLEVRLLTLPDGLDPADFLASRGADAFRESLDRAVDPLDYLVDRAAERFDIHEIEQARKAADWILSAIIKIDPRPGTRMSSRVDQSIDRISRRLRIPLREIQAGMRRLRGQGRPSAAAPAAAAPATPAIPIKGLDPIDSELVRILLNEPGLVGRLITTVAVADLRDSPLRTILAACFDAHAEGGSPEFSAIAPKLDEAERSLAAGLLLPVDPSPFTDAARPAPWAERLPGVLTALAVRRLEERRRDLLGALQETDPVSHPDDYRALQAEYIRLLMTPRPDSKKTIAS